MVQIFQTEKNIDTVDIQNMYVYTIYILAEMSGNRFFRDIIEFYP